MHVYMYINMYYRHGIRFVTHPVFLKVIYFILWHVWPDKMFRCTYTFPTTDPSPVLCRIDMCDNILGSEQDAKPFVDDFSYAFSWKKKRISKKNPLKVVTLGAVDNTSTLVHDGLAATKQEVIQSMRPSDAYMRRRPRASLVQIMACRLSGAKPLSESMLDYCQLGP